MCGILFIQEPRCLRPNATPPIYTPYTLSLTASALTYMATASSPRPISSSREARLCCRLAVIGWLGPIRRSDSSRAWGQTERGHVMGWAIGREGVM